MKDYGTLSQAINKLKLEEGYEHDFNLLDEEAGNEESREQRTGHDEVAPTSKASLP